MAILNAKSDTTMPRKQTKKKDSAKAKDPVKKDTETAPSHPSPETEKEETPAQPVSAITETEGHEEAEESTAPQGRNVPPNHIFIGKKPVMGYALSAVMQLTQYPTVVLRARGRAISTAVDVAQVATKRLGNGQFDVKDVKIDTEIIGEGQEARNVSTIEITLGKK
jgi:DNA-binding protein